MGNGRVIEGRFECRESLKRPEPGESFLAADRGSGQDVVIRILAEQVSDDAHQRRFFERIENVVRMNGKNLEKVLDAGLVDGTTPYVVTERTKGGGLDELMSGGSPLPVLRSVDIARQLARALSDASRAGCVHGHLSARTIILASGKRGKGADRVKIIGWAPWDLTESRALQDFDTVSPEVILGAEPDTRSDCYAMGVVLYTMLTGRTPWTATTREAKTLAHLNDRIDVPSVVRGDGEITPALDNLVLRLLEKNPDKRLAIPDQILVHLESIHSNEQEATLDLSESDVVEQATAIAAAAVPEVESDLDEGISFASGRRIKTTDFASIKVTELMGSIPAPTAGVTTAQIGACEPVSVVSGAESQATLNQPAPIGAGTGAVKSGGRPSTLAAVALAGFFLLAAIGVTGWFVLQYQTKKLELQNQAAVTTAPARAAQTAAEPAPAPSPATVPVQPPATPPAQPVVQVPASTPAAATQPTKNDPTPPGTAPKLDDRPRVNADTKAERKAAARSEAAPAAGAESKPATKPATKPAAKAESAPAAKPATKPAAKVEPAPKPAAKPAARINWDDETDDAPAKPAAAEKNSNKKPSGSKETAPEINWDE